MKSDRQSLILANRLFFDALSQRPVERSIIIVSDGILPDSPVVFALPGQAVLRLSPTAAPRAVEADQTLARAAKQYLGSELGQPILDPLLEGEADGRSFVVLPWREPLQASPIWRPYQILRHARPIARWLQAVAADRHEPASKSSLESDLVVLLDLPETPAGLRDATEAALGRLASVDRGLVHVPMHGDLWFGNILYAPIWQKWPFTLIDWGGSSVRGYPFFDLMRLASSMRFPEGITRRELKSHCRAVGCEPLDVPAYILATLGHIRRTQPGFHHHRFLGLATRLLGQLDRLRL